MPKARANGIRIEYDTFGDPRQPPLLLISGLGRQMVFWDEAFCKQLADKGLYVIRFDNRDAGLSTRFEAGGIPDIASVFAAATQGQAVEVPYTLDDMADDARGLLDALGIEKAHICGASMGAAITQIMGYRHPERVLTLIPIMGTTGNPELPQPDPEARKILIEPAPKEREAYLAHAVKTRKIFSGSIADNEEVIRQKAALEYDRAFYPQGLVRQMAAIFSHGNRKPVLGLIKAPTLVIHGSEDPLVPLAGGKDTAEAVAGAELLVIEGMGHGLPESVWPRVVDAIAEHAGKVGGS